MELMPMQSLGKLDVQTVICENISLVERGDKLIELTIAGSYARILVRKNIKPTDKWKPIDYLNGMKLNGQIQETENGYRMESQDISIGNYKLKFFTLVPKSYYDKEINSTEIIIIGLIEDGKVKKSTKFEYACDIARAIDYFHTYH